MPVPISWALPRNWCSAGGAHRTIGPCRRWSRSPRVARPSRPGPGSRPGRRSSRRSARRRRPRRSRAWRSRPDGWATRPGPSMPASGPSCCTGGGATTRPPRGWPRSSPWRSWSHAATPQWPRAGWHGPGTCSATGRCPPGTPWSTGSRAGWRACTSGTFPVPAGCWSAPPPGPARPATWTGSCWPAPSSVSSWSAPARSPTGCACSTAPPQEPSAARSPTPPARSPSAACSPWPAWPSGTWNGRRNGRAMPWTRRPAGAAGPCSTTRAPTGRRC